MLVDWSMACWLSSPEERFESSIVESSIWIPSPVWVWMSPSTVESLTLTFPSPICWLKSRFPWFSMFYVIVLTNS
jgi:hypothetical protein